MRISDWSSDVCSSDLGLVGRHWPVPDGQEAGVRRLPVAGHPGRRDACDLSATRRASGGSGLAPGAWRAPPAGPADCLLTGRSQTDSLLPCSWKRTCRTMLTRYARSSSNRPASRSEEHTSELQSLMRISYAVFCLKKKKKTHK